MSQNRNWLETASQLVNSDRQADYGHPLIEFIQIAIKWSLLLGTLIDPYDVARMMIDVKMVRDANRYKEDNWIDTIGYSATVQKMIDLLAELHMKPDAIEKPKVVYDPENFIYALLTILRLAKFHLARSGS